ncbi:hypothetical protein BpHYR1_004670 [Brachionus plicatilis]|uniref:Uncharacterized protein n=1 Tax=Brachionus plicatilis TaxID=10195 RepID=A0A3M7RZE4_BRAPC|nr:hypothetical protein BpHYR1_004670 [Brachionus plicatilis]
MVFARRIFRKLKLLFGFNFNKFFSRKLVLTTLRVKPKSNLFSFGVNYIVSIYLNIYLNFFFLYLLKKNGKKEKS